MMKRASRMLVAALFFTGGLSLIQASTVAYWRFEVGPANAPVAHAGADGVFDGATPDDSGNGNNLSAWSQGGWAGFAYRSEVPSTSVPQSGLTNRFSVQNTGPYPTLFTSPSGGLPTGINARTITPLKFTIEVSYKPEANGGYRTVVGRDARNVSAANSDLAALYLQVRPDDSVGILFTDVSGYTHSAFSPPGLIYGFNFSKNPQGTNVSWYRLAAVSDGSTLKMYVDNLLVASTSIASSGSPNRSLAVGTTSGTDWVAGAWTVGRGLYAGGHTDRAYGFIDEVRISNSALTPGEFLSAPRPILTKTAVYGKSMTFTGTSGQPGATYYILQSIDAASPPANWTPIATNAFDVSGSFSFSDTINSSSGGRFFRVKAVIPVPAPGPLTYELAGGSENWPPDIRSQIVYAMDGAVALYNRYGTFRKHLYANYNPGVPTAQANYDGWIDFGGQIGYRTAVHEISHTLGIGTAPNYGSFVQNGTWTGTRAQQQLRVFDGSTATLYTDGTHFWPYGLNYENEGSTENNRRHVLMVAAFRRDMGIQ